MARVEIIGLDKLRNALSRGLPSDMTPFVLREIARKPAQSASKVARDFMPIGDTGATGRTIGVRKVNNAKQTFVEVGFRGRSLGHIYISGETITRSKRGTVKGFPWLFRRTGESVKISGKAELKADMSKLIARGLKKRGYG
jgi:hypothetical protein